MRDFNLLNSKSWVVGIMLYGGFSFGQVYPILTPDTANAVDVSENGIVVLDSSSANYMWSLEGGLVTLNTFSGVNNAGNPAISNDGTKISASVINPASGLVEMGIYDVASGTWSYKGGLAGSSDGHSSSAWGFSGNGQIVVGLGWINAGLAHAIKWSEETGLVDMGSTVEGSSSRANAANYDGSVIVGWQDTESGFRQAAVWVDGVQNLIFDNEGNAVGEAGAISDDGNWVVGGNHMFSAWKWSEESGLTLIEHPNAGFFYQGAATAVSGDGSVIVGYYRPWPGGPYFGEGFIWTEETGRVNLNDYVESLGLDRQGLSLNLPLGISADGKKIVGAGLDSSNQTVSFLVILPGDETLEGCLDAPNGQYPSYIYTPSCVGVPEEVTALAWTGEYSKVNVTAGTTYIFSCSVDTDFITISDENGQTVYAAGTTPVTWTATANETIRFYLHFDSDCSWADSGLRSRLVQCGEVPPPPSACEDFEVLSNNLENGLFFGGDTNQRMAVDVPVAENGFTVYGMEPTVIGEATSFTFIFYQDNGGVPGTQFATRTGTIMGEEITGNNFGYDFIKYTVGFDQPIDFEANTTYWVEVQSDAVAWEVTSNPFSILGNDDVFWNTNVSGWTPTGGDQYVFNLVCQELGVTDLSGFEFAYYPNPVKDILNINAKKAVKTVETFNLAGQKVMNDAQVSNGQINVSTLTPGTYVFRVTLEGGQVETFKIVVK